MAPTRLPASVGVPALAYGWNDLSVDRFMSLRSLGQGLTSSPNGDTAQVPGEGAKGFGVPVGRIELFAGRSFIHATIDSFSKSRGSGSLSGMSMRQDNTSSNLERILI